MIRKVIGGSGLALSVLAFLLAGVLLLAGLGVVGASIAEDCGSETFKFGPAGEVIEHRKFDCDRSPELIPYGLAVIGGGGLAMWGLVVADRRRALGMIATVLGALPAVPLIAVSALGLVPLILLPIGIAGIALRGKAVDHAAP